MIGLPIACIPSATATTRVTTVSHAVFDTEQIFGEMDKGARYAQAVAEPGDDQHPEGPRIERLPDFQPGKRLRRFGHALHSSTALRPGAHEYQYGRQRDHKYEASQRQVGGPPSVRRDDTFGQNHHARPAHFHAGHCQPEHQPETLVEPVGYNERSWYESRGSKSQAEYDVSGEERRKRIGAACQDKTPDHEHRSRPHHPARLDSVEQPSGDQYARNEAHREPHAHQAKSGLAPAEVFEQRREKYGERFVA